ncbi:Endoribonuclease L-PSP/chorismate mutase-like protein [Niveomyces insectorum RCEF 264]|uniref:Endoribonuclease L-PSP/chorismate mutase-like protein n=1 Tax=Niveomyces insectorum RCEF 264 TaxID=1081102 RepID=A0A167T8M2_9HYPO|nr:Endoribonuclease L-PSP/chorismate mutase-like protein [Niveomyces insectorum RCEF 264]
MAQSTLSLVNPASVAPSGPFSHGLVIPAGFDIIVTAGQIGTSDAEGTIPESYEEQVDAAVKNLGAVLAEAGATPKDIIKLTYYIVDYDVSIRPVHINALLKFLDGHRPGTALIGVAKLGNPKLKFEIEAIAAVKGGTRTVKAADLA